MAWRGVVSRRVTSVSLLGKTQVRCLSTNGYSHLLLVWFVCLMCLFRYVCFVCMLLVFVILCLWLLTLQLGTASIAASGATVAGPGHSAPQGPGPLSAALLVAPHLRSAESDRARISLLSKVLLHLVSKFT